jgi:hypothetical protein
MSQRAIHIPSAVSILPREICRPPKGWVPAKHTKLIHFNELNHGGLFATREQPRLFVDELREGLAPVR